MRSRRIPALLAPLALVAALAACGSGDAVTSESELTDAVALAGNGTGEMDLVSALHVEWQRAVVACPGDDPADVLAAGGDATNPGTGEVPDLTDGATGHLVLFNGGKVTSTVDVPLDEVDLCSTSTGPVALTPGSSTMSVTPGDDGAWIVTPD